MWLKKTKYVTFAFEHKQKEIDKSREACGEECSIYFIINYIPSEKLCYLLKLDGLITSDLGTSTGMINLTVC